jgi:hypothetical protein
MKGLSCVRPTKVQSFNVDLHVLILGTYPVVPKCASFGPTSFLKFQDKYLLHYQIETIKDIFPKAEINIAVGLYADKLIKIMPDYVRCLENQLFDITNEVESIRLFLNNTAIKNLLIIDINTIFRKTHLEQIDLHRSTILSSNELSREEVSLTVVDDKISIFTFGTDYKFAHTTYLQGKELDNFTSLCKQRVHNKLFMFEVLNKIIDRGGKIHNKAVTNLFRLNDYHTFKNYNNIPQHP